MKVVERFVTTATQDTVWQLLIDVEHWNTWTPTIEKVEALTPGGMQQGARYSVKQPKLRAAVYEVTEFSAGTSFTWEQRMPGGALVAAHGVEVKSGTTEVQLSFDSRGFLGGMVARIYAKVLQEFVAMEANSLRERLERH